jgi:hypothetical protein
MMSFCPSRIRTSLLVSVSVLAITVATPELAKPADLPTKAPIVAPAPQGIWTAYIEGGPMWTGGGGTSYFDPASGFSRSFGRPPVGWTIAGLIDYQFAASPYHVSFDFRYGQSGKRTQNNFVAFGYESGTASSQASHREHHWVADFMVGRDIGIGQQSQVKVGLRVADLRATTDYNGVYVSYYAGSYGYSFTQRSKFLGFGPRAAIMGVFAISGPWSIDYQAGVAALYGNRQLNITGSACAACNPFPVGSFDSKGWVPNVDASLGIAYAFTPAMKISVGVQVDQYWNALRTFDLNQGVVNTDRTYWGPFVRLTGRFN